MMTRSRSQQSQFKKWQWEVIAVDLMMMLIFNNGADICDFDKNDIEAVDDFHSPELLLYKIKF